VPNPDITIRHFFIAVRLSPSRSAVSDTSPPPSNEAAACAARPEPGCGGGGGGGGRTHGADARRGCGPRCGVRGAVPPGAAGLGSNTTGQHLCVEYNTPWVSINKPINTEAVYRMLGMANLEYLFGATSASKALLDLPNR
jgi:hypothetical protein